MPLPVFLYALWALWPLAAFPGGKLFAPLVVLIGLFALPGLKLRRIGWPVRIGLVLLVWICISALWSPAGEVFFSGSLLEQDFALEASYVRFAATLAGCFLFVRLVLKSAPEKLARVPLWIYGGIGLHILIVLYMALSRDNLLASAGEFLVPTGQSMGRNANLLGMATPLLIGGIVLHLRGLRAGFMAGSVVLLLVFLVLMLDGLAAILGGVIGLAVYAILRFGGQSGFRTLFNTTAAGLLSAPFLAYGLSAFSPALAGSIPLTAQQRLLIWQATLERILEKPFFGHGVNAAPTWTETYASRPAFLEQLAPELINHRIIPNHPHNMALQIWAETGLVGALLGAAVLVLAGRVLPAPAQLSPAVKIATAGLFGTALAYFAVSYSVWDESYWASLAIVMSGIIVLHRKAAA